MTSQATQRTRQLAISDIVGDDVLLLKKIEGTEELSRLFHYDLELDSEEANLDPRQIVGRNVTIPSRLRRTRSSLPQWVRQRVSQQWLVGAIHALPSDRRTMALGF